MKLTSPDSDGLTDEEFAEYKALTTSPSKINERKVLKVASNQPQEPMQQEPVADMGANMNNMKEEIPPMEDNNGGSEFDTNFDAGVEADEDEDPKKYIQQLTGKLSQELSKYNNEMGELDVELGKYVGGMIIKQVAKTLDDEGKKELIKKINTTKSNEEEPEDLEMNDEEMVDDTEAPEAEMQQESYSLNKKEISKLMEHAKKIKNK